MIKIYFDNTLIDSDHYLEIKNDYKMFDKQFYLGATPCNSFTLKVPNTYSVPNEVKIVMDTNTEFATLIVDSYEINDDDILVLKLVDKMVLFDKEYDASGIVPCTTMDILSDICTTFGVTLGTDSFINDDIAVDYYDNTITAREYISFLAELNGGYARIGADGKLYLEQFNNTPIEFDIGECENFKVGEKRTIERVVFDNGLLKYETSNDTTLETLYLNSANVYINDQNTFDNIANEILGFEFYNFSTGNCQVDYTATCGKLIKFTDENNNEYVSISQYSHEYNSCWLGGYDLNLDSVFQTETEIKGNDDKIKSIKVILNRQENTLNIVVEDVGDNTDEISTMKLEQDRISSAVTQTAKAVEDTNAELEEYKTTVSNTFTQTAEDYTMLFTQAIDKANETAETENEHYQESQQYIRFSGDTVTLGKSDSPFTAELSSTELAFKQNGDKVAYVSNNKLFITNAEIITEVVIGEFRFVPRSNGSLSFRKGN